MGVIEGMTSVYPGAEMRLEICGEDGMVSFSADAIYRWELRNGRPMPECKGDAGQTSFNDPKAFKIDGHARQLTDMVDAIIHDRPPKVDMYEGRKSVALILSIYESSKTGQKVAVTSRKAR
jgi:predicted dehydrogenase